MEPVVLSTERLVLSLPFEDDIEAICDACQDADIQRFTTVPSPYERKHAEDFVPKAANGWSEGTEVTWAIRDADMLAGIIGLYRVASGAGEIA